MALTVTATATGTTPSNGVSLRIFVITGAKARTSQAGATASQSAAAAHQATISTAAGSEVFGALFGVSSFTFDSGSTSVDNINDAGNGVQYGSFKSTASGSRTVGASAPTTSGGMGALEVQASGTIAEDGSAPVVATNKTGTSVTSASFSPPAGSLIVAIVSLFGAAGVATASVTDTSSLTWTEKIAGHASGMGYAGVWIADAPGSTPVSGADTAAGTDTATMGAAVTGADTATGTDTSTLAATAAGADTAAGTDTATVGVPVSGSDTATGTDTASVAPHLTGADTAAGTDTASVAAAVSGADTAAGADNASAGNISGADTATGTDSATVVKPAAAFPAGPLDATVELDLDGWTDITPYIAYKKAPLQISRGHPDESTNTNPSSMTAVLDNTDKRFTSKNPLGAFYGLIGRNTPVRVSIPEAANYLRLETDAASYAQAPDTAGLSITGDMDLRLDLTLDNWRAQQLLAGKWADTGNERTWLLTLQENGALTFSFSTNGTGVDAATSTASVPVPPLRRQSLRVTYATATGTIIFYTATSIGGSWTQLGSTQSFGSSLALFNSTAPVQAGFVSDAATDFPAATGIYGQVHEFIILSGISGTTKGDANFALATAGASSYTDPQANVWTCEGTSEISGRKYRYHGEASSWTPYSEGTLGKDLWCGLAAGGLLRRIQQNTQTLGSVFFRAFTEVDPPNDLIGYWSAEDGNTTASGATPATPTQFAPGLPGLAAGTFTGGPPSFASDSSFLCSQSLPGMNGSRWHFHLPARAAADNANIFRFLLSMPSASDTNGGVIARMQTAGTIARLDLVYSTGGGLTLNGYDVGTNSLFSIGPDAFGTDGTPMWVSMELQQSGSSVQYSVVTLKPGATSGNAMTGTLSSATIGNATQFTINATGAAVLQGSALGQITYQGTWETLFDFAAQLDAYQGEAAGQRFARLCAEQGIPFRAVGSLDDTVVMGAQTPVAFSALLQECVDADTGQMFEPRQALALGYRTRRSLENQAPGIALDYSLDGYTGFLTPTEDDQYTKNDVVATRAYAAGGGTGSSAEAVITEGPLSVQDPPDGVGPYLDSVTVNVNLDTQLPDIASWRAWLGSVNQPRYPAIPYDLARKDIGANLYAVPDLDIGDRLTIGSPPAWEPPDGISQLVQQATEDIGERSYSIAWTGVPEQPYELAIADDPLLARADSPDSTLHTGITSSATSMSVSAGASGELWSTSSGDWPFDVVLGGERITVGAVSGSSSPQTFSSLTRSVNGVVKAQTAGQAVSLFYPSIAAL